MSKETPKGLLKGKTGGIGHKWWLVGGLAVGGIGFMYYRHAANAGTATANTASATDPNAYDPMNDPYTGYDGSYGSSSLGGFPGSTTTPVTDPNSDVLAQSAVDSATALGDIAGSFGDIATAATTPAETNTDWMHQAIHALEQHGYTKAAATAAVTAYLAGAPMTHKQIATVESAIGRIGAPPSSTPGIHSVPTQKPKHHAAKPKPKKKHHHHSDPTARF